VFRKLWELDDPLAEWRTLRLAYPLWYWRSTFITDYRDQLVEIYQRYEATRPALLRVFARHFPQEAIKLAPDGTEFASSRAWYLTAFEAGKHSTQPRSIRKYVQSPREAVKSGPPTVSFL
jgi:hypothetical protein